jgi:hypothetical protein
MPEPLTQLALVALGEVAPAEQIGELVSTSEPNEEGVRTLRFASDVPGHPDWFWTVWTTQVEDALLAPAWIPWAERLAEFRATHDRNGKLVDEDDDDELDDEGEAPEVESDADADNDGETESEAPRSSRGKSSTRTQRRTRRRRRRRSS